MGEGTGRREKVKEARDGGFRGGLEGDGAGREAQPKGKVGEVPCCMSGP